MSNIDLIIPTFNSPEYSVPCIQSILRDADPDLFRIILVNNGEARHKAYFPTDSSLVFVQNEKNLGWEGGLQSGLKVSDAPYVVFMNDDTYIPISSEGWLEKMLSHFEDPQCAAVGPSSNVVMGTQNMFFESKPILKVSFLIGLCMMLRRSDLDAAGGVDVTLPGGDDLDLSIRLKNLGKHLICDKTVFVYHHGFKTGQKVHGSDWNSVSMVERTNHALIRKHGLRALLDLRKPVATNGHH